MGLRIKEICKQKGLSISDIADRLGMDTSNLYSSLKGNPSLKRLQEIAEALNVNVGQLFEGNEPDEFTGLITMNGGTYKIAKATDDNVSLPVYANYSVFREDLATFVANSIQDNKVSSFIGMLETFEIFNLVYFAECRTFILTLCYGKEHVLTKTFDCFNDYGDGDSFVDIDMLLADIRNDMEQWVPTEIRKKSQ